PAIRLVLPGQHSLVQSGRARWTCDNGPTRRRFSLRSELETAWRQWRNRMEIIARKKLFSWGLWLRQVRPSSLSSVDIHPLAVLLFPLFIESAVRRSYHY